MSLFQNQVKKTQVCISGTTGCKNVKVRKNQEHWLLIFLLLLVDNVQIQVLFSQFCVIGVITVDKFLKILKLGS